MIGLNRAESNWRAIASHCRDAQIFHLTHCLFRSSRLSRFLIWYKILHNLLTTLGQKQEDAASSNPSFKLASVLWKKKLSLTFCPLGVTWKVHFKSMENRPNTHSPKQVYSEVLRYSLGLTPKKVLLRFQPWIPCITEQLEYNTELTCFRVHLWSALWALFTDIWVPSSNIYNMFVRTKYLI